ncbi:SnoaL-like domain-containing protein [Streptomyces sp. 3213]|uniref:nuclear transport factor 2 family protein n=1 Tax=Streptomyces sp. 3213.3 TaxID=1855348 RepID=UPI00089A6FDB|nr:nuclear transport factor 2 family protein [Streptomyces sp. 3213.3]SEC42035.1 SnoaL-like domain-containing protein [Streptomyces sp. 3213] [Streptomyces sp. 3213.3]
MTEKTRGLNGYEAIDRMYTATEDGDMELLLTCFASDAVVWHADDEVEQDVDTCLQRIAQLGPASSKVAYEDRRMTAVGQQVFLQHTLTADLLTGSRLRLPAFMRVELSPDGLISRLEEYYDSRATDVLAEAGL